MRNLYKSYTMLFCAIKIEVHQAFRKPRADKDYVVKTLASNFVLHCLTLSSSVSISVLMIETSENVQLKLFN